jgi:uncharacterized protein YjbI with pentapeptide repeats
VPPRTDERHPVAPRLAAQLTRIVNVRADDVDEGDGDEREPLDDDAVIDWRDVHWTGDLSGAQLDVFEVLGSRLTESRFTGARLGRARMSDVLLDSCDLSGADLESASLTRVELRHCRLSSTLLGRARLRDVRFVDCRVDGLNLRQAAGEHLTLERCAAAGLDLSAATVDDVRLLACDLTGFDVSQSRLTGLRLHGSDISGTRGVLALRGAQLDVAQLTDLAFAFCAAQGLIVSDDDGAAGGPASTDRR